MYDSDDSSKKLGLVLRKGFAVMVFMCLFSKADMHKGNPGSYELTVNTEEIRDI